MSGKLAYVGLSFKSDHFDAIVGAYASKFAALPHRVQETPLTTRMGVQYVNRTVYWMTDGGEFSISRYGSTIEDGIGVIASDEWLAHERHKDKAEKDAIKHKL